MFLCLWVVGGRAGVDELIEERGELWHDSKVPEHAFDFEVSPQARSSNSSTVQQLSSNERLFALTVRRSSTVVYFSHTAL